MSGQPESPNWNLEEGYNDSLGQESSLEFYPHRVLGTGSVNGLNVMVSLNPSTVQIMMI